MTTSYETAAINAGITMLSAAAAITTALGEISPSSRIIKADGGGTPDGTTATALDGTQFLTATESLWFIVDHKNYHREQISLAGYKYTGIFLLQLYQAIPANTLASAITDGARDFAGTVLDQITAQIGNSGCFAQLTRAEIVDCAIVDEDSDLGAPGVHPGYTVTEYELEWLAFGSVGVGSAPKPVAIRPQNSVLQSLGPGTVHYYFPLDRMCDHDSQTSFVSIAGTGSSMWAKGATDPTTVPGHFDWAQTGAVINLDSFGAGGANIYPTGAPWTWSYSLRFRQLALSQTFDIVWKVIGGNSQFLMRFTAGALGAFGYCNQNGYMFPANDPPYYALLSCGTVPNDLLDHIVQVTITNDPTASGGGGVMKVWVDGVLQGIFTGRPGAYIGAGINNRNYVGGFQGANPVQVAYSDVGEWLADFADTPLQAAL